MSFVAGFVDTGAFIALFGLFTAHVTGNFVLIGASLARGNTAIYDKLLAFPVFLFAVAATRIFEVWRTRRGLDAAKPILIGEILFLVLFLACGVHFTPELVADSPTTILVGMLGVVAMAIQNAASRSIFAGHGPTTVMTGNVTQVMMDLADLVCANAPASAHARLRKMSLAVVSFTIGAIAGGVGMARFGFACMLAPIAAVLIVLVQRYRSASSRTFAS